MNYKKLNTLVGWLVFAVAMTVYYFSAERTGSLWDCGEFITGAYKLQVVHPPGAPLFIIIGRMFVSVAELISDTEAHPENIAFAVNLMSSVCTAFAAMFTCWATTILGRIALVGREQTPDQSESIAILGAGLVAGLTAAFCTSVWFSAVEGEVYAMSTFFTCLTFWSMMKWYSLPDEPDTDRWLIFAIFATGLSIGVHLLSLLTFPALAMFYYFKKKPSTSAIMTVAGGLLGFIFIYAVLGKVGSSEISGLLRFGLFGTLAYLAFTSKLRVTNEKTDTVSIKGTIASAVIGVGFIVLIQELIITGIPKLWKSLEFMMVNYVGTGFHSGTYPLILLVGGILVGGFYMAHRTNSAMLQKLMVVA